MNKETLKALRGSIRKWDRIVNGTEIDKAKAAARAESRFLKSLLPKGKKK